MWQSENCDVCANILYWRIYYMDKYILKVWSGLRNEITFILSPTEKWGTKTEYTKLKKFLHKDGYLRIAPEVYMRIVQNRKASEKHFRRIEEYAPKTGTVRLLRLTEKQYNNIYLVTGEQKKKKKIVGTNSHIMQKYDL